MERLYYELFSGSGLLEVCQMLLGQFDFIGLTEYTKLSLMGVAEAWRLPYPSREYKENTNPERANYAEMVSEAVRKEFYRKNEVDYELYNLVKKRLVRESPRRLWSHSKSLSSKSNFISRFCFRAPTLPF